MILQRVSGAEASGVAWTGVLSHAPLARKAHVHSQ
jgi:hypothetical protein